MYAHLKHTGILTRLNEDTYPIPCLNITGQIVTHLNGISDFVSTDETNKILTLVNCSINKSYHKNM